MTRLTTNDLEPPRSVGHFYPDALEMVTTRRVPQAGRRNIGAKLGLESNTSQVAFYRARAKVRRFVVGNRLNRFVTLTSSHAQLSALVGSLVRLLRSRRRFIRRPFPFLWVPEKSGKPHIHLFVDADHAEAIAAKWTLGFADSSELVQISDQRKAALYVAKDFGNPPLLSHRYHASRGYHPTSDLIEGDSVDEVVRRAADIVGREPDRIEAGRERGPITAYWELS